MKTFTATAEGLPPTHERTDGRRGKDGPSGGELVTYPDELLEVATARMLEHDIGHLPVVSRAEPGRLLGHIDRAAVMTAWAHASREEGAREAGGITDRLRALREHLGGAA